MPENPVATAQSAPTAGEQLDAQVDFVKTRGIFEQAAEMAPHVEAIQQMLAEQDLAKAQGGGAVIIDYETARKRNAQQRGGKSVFLDEYQVQYQGEYWDRPGVLSFESMRAMVDRTPILNAIVQTRIRQVQRFCRPQIDRKEPGFVIQHVDPTVELNAEQQTSVQLLQKFITNCGWETDPRKRKRLKRDTFSTFMAKSVRDTLTMDAAPIETEFKRNRDLGIDGFYAADGATIRLCTEDGYEGDDEVFAVQVIQGRIRTAYDLDGLVYEVRNPRTDVLACGYGYSETEMLIKVVTYLLNTMAYNGSYFDQNSIPRGILQVYGNYDQSDVSSFKRYWNAMVRGAQNHHNLPVLVSKDQESGANFTEVGGQMDEMGFSKWMTWLTSIASAIYSIAPEEISMESFAASKSSLSGSDTEEKLVSSNDKGLRPLLNFYENTFSDYIIQPFSEQYMMRFVGIDAEDAKQRFERQKLALTWNELRQIDGMDAVPGKVGDAPLNPSLLTVWQAENGIGQEQPDFGDPNAGGAAPMPGEAGDDPDGDMAGDPNAEQDPAMAGAPAPGGEPDFGTGGDPMAKAMTPADFGLPPIYILEV